MGRMANAKGVKGYLGWNQRAGVGNHLLYKIIILVKGPATKAKAIKAYP